MLLTRSFFNNEPIRQVSKLTTGINRLAVDQFFFDFSLLEGKVKRLITVARLDGRNNDWKIDI